MTITMTSTFDTLDQITNTREDLIGTGIPQEHIFVDKPHRQLKVMVPKAIEAEIEEILERHHASETTMTMQ